MSPSQTPIIWLGSGPSSNPFSFICFSTFVTRLIGASSSLVSNGLSDLKKRIVYSYNIWRCFLLSAISGRFFSLRQIRYNDNLTKFRPLLTLSHRGSDNSPLLIVFGGNYIDQSNVTFMWPKQFGSFDLLIWVNHMSEVTRKHNSKMTFVIFNNTARRLKYAIWLIGIITLYANTKFKQSSLEQDQ